MGFRVTPPPPRRAIFFPPFPLWESDLGYPAASTPLTHCDHWEGERGWARAARRRSTRREERVTVQGPVKQQHPDGPHARRNTARQVVDDQNAGALGSKG